MFTFTRQSEPTELDKAITEVHREMAGMNADSDEFAKSVDQLSKLYTMKPTPSRVSADTLAIVFGNLAGIVVIVGHERAHVITSKALSFILKAK